MAKKTLNEAMVRRFQKLANLSPINEMYHKRDEEEMTELASHGVPMNKRDDDEVMKEEEEEMEIDAEMDADAAPEAEMEADAEMDGDLELTDDEAQAIIDLGSKLQAAMGGMGEMDEMEVDAEVDAEMPMDAAADMDAEDELMEALRGISYTPSKNEVVNEVAKRVAMRLKSAKLHESKLKRALGRK